MQMFRQTVFIAKGIFEYTRGGFERASRNFEAEDVSVDLTGKSIAITGANSGIGLETAITLAEKGAQVLMICRDRTRGQDAFEKVKANSKEGVDPRLFILDMSKPRDIHKFIRSFCESKQHVDILINNAGCMIQHRCDVEGVETNFSTNTLGVYILTKGLIPVLQKSTDPRVITVSSAGMLTQTLNYDDFNNTKNSMKEKFDGTSVYAQNKRQQVIMTEEFALGYPDIFFATMHPGWVDTEAVKTSMPGFYRIMQSKLRTPAQGSDTVVWLCSMNNIFRKFRSGQFFQDRMVVSKHLYWGGTKSTPEQNKLLVNSLDELSKMFEE